MRRPCFDNRFDPVVAYLMTPDEATTDRSGNGLDLTASGTYVPVSSYADGLAALWLDNTHYFDLDAAATKITGDVTIEFVATRTSAGTTPPNDVYFVCQQGGEGETEATNFLYAAGFNQNRMTLFYEYGTGTNQDAFVSGGLGNLGGYHHFLYVRSSTLFYGYMDGVLLGTYSLTQAASGGADTLLRIGRAIPLTQTAQPMNDALQYFSIYDKALTADQAKYLSALRGITL